MQMQYRENKLLTATCSGAFQSVLCGMIQLDFDY